MTSACGFLVLDKPAGPTSHDCVALARRRLGLRRIGHGGTLDPAVTGVLPLAVGPATRLLPYLDGRKEYAGTIQLGLRTVTDDLQGEVLERQPWPALEAAALETELLGFLGSLHQRPPQVSAVHVDGERAHARVRRGEALDLPERLVTIDDLRLTHWDPQTGVVGLWLRCSAGTYVRALARDLGQRLGCGGALASLRRTHALGFGLDQALAPEQLQPGIPLQDPLIALGHLPRRRLDSHEWLAWTRGQRLPAGEEGPEEEAVVMLRPDGSLAGMARRSDDGRLQPRLVFDASG
ncbi:MAG: tRNA pseudouridine(55) synthase TruB [Synechococcus sp. Tobar2m-G35]|nr:tRNA pseudouridine(55) synthase TruB [Synechococcus sp. Tobar2m-G35]